ncbi:MAG: hypothetical protein EXR55_06605 [Dehalococcoidia bacterium]|nr:hypothetical protein [Dehalococcoidia bacterium]
MTPQRTRRETAANQTAGQRLYAIDLEWYHTTGRSLAKLLESRRCASCQAELRRGNTPASVEEHLREILRGCSRKKEYMGDHMTLMEAVFRIFLRGGNTPKTAQEVHRDLSAHLEARPYSRVLPLQWVETMLNGSNPYGIRPTVE